MAGHLYLAAGGGGDAIAAAILHSALTEERSRPVIATCAWDRLMVDPLPGPRSVADFSGLARLTEHCYAITPATSPVHPAGSTLPRLAGELRAQLVMLDFTDGAVGLRRQIHELTHYTEASAIHIVDVGGDVVAEGHEPTLLSPLADGLALASCTEVDIPVSVLVAGAGLDGELPEDYVRARCTDLGGVQALQLDAEHTRAVRHVLDWHPSEATALLVAATVGLRGNVEIRDRGLPVQLTDHSCEVWQMAHAAVLAASTIAHKVSETTSLAQAEAAVLRITGKSEIEYERNKSAVRRDPHYDIGLIDLISRLESYDREARSRGVDYVTHRRLAEVLGLPPAARAQLRETVHARHDAANAWPLLRIPENP